MGGEAIEHVDILRKSDSYTDVDGHRLRPFEVRECAIKTTVVLEPETAPERRTGYEDRAPILTNVRGSGQVLLAVAIFEDPGQELWRKPVGGNKCVLDRPNHLRNLGEITFDATELRIV